MKFWRGLSLFFGGVISGMIVFMRLKKSDTSIEADTYIKDQQQNVKKIKQRGDGSLQVDLSQDNSATTKTRKEIRQERREARKAKRLSRKPE